MTTQRIVSLVDDTDGSEAVETVRFALDKVDYEIDLNEFNASALRKALADFTANARRLPASGKGKKARTPTQRTIVIREWAKARGIQLHERGRIPADIVAKYELDLLGAKPYPATKPAEPANPASTAVADASPEPPAEPATEPPGPVDAGTEPANGNRNAAIRMWAKRKGIKVNERGRIPANVVAEYEAQSGN